MDGAIIFHDMVMANAMSERWPGIEDFELAKLIDDAAIRIDVSLDHTKDFPDPFFLRKTRTDPNSGKKYYFCERVTTKGFYHTHCSGNEGVYDFESIAFSAEQVSEWERNRPWLKFIESTPGDDEWMPAEEARKQMKKTPMEFVRILENGMLETNCQEEFEEYMISGLNDPFYRVKDIQELRVHRLSFQRYIEQEVKEKEEARLQAEAGTTPWGTTPPKKTMSLVFPAAPSEGQDAELAQARQEIERLTLEVERLKAGGNGAGIVHLDCVDCPSGQDAAKRLEVFKMGVRMGLRCANDGAQQSKEAHLALWREIHGVKEGKPNSRCFDAFRLVLDEAPHLKHPDPKKK
jgi:hypothetical protein